MSVIDQQQKELDWPPLPYEKWKDTYATVHMWAQIVGKVQLAFNPPVNHWWHVTFMVNSLGLTTPSIPHHNVQFRDLHFEVQFDFVEHQLLISTSEGQHGRIPLQPYTVADFYQKFMDALSSVGIDGKSRVWPQPVEVQNGIPFDQDVQHHSYDREYVERFHRVLLSVDNVLKEFRSGFLGKSSPVHFFWGSFDLAVTRFSGRRAPERPGADAMTREAYSHEVSSAGFWPGAGYGAPAFYSYAAPEPPDFAAAPVRPEGAFYSKDLSEYLLPYEVVRTADDPRAALRAFLDSTYEAAATLGHWDRELLEKK